MKTPVPPHYRAFRIVLVGVVLAALGAAIWWMAQTGVLGDILSVLGVG